MRCGGVIPGSFSGGQKQRLAIASILALEPKVLMMDEPVTDLDPKGREGILSISEKLKAEKRTLIVVDNEPENIADADYIWLMRDGEIAVRDRAGAVILSDVRLLRRAGVMVPPTVSFFHAMGWPGSPLTFPQAASLIKQHDLVSFCGKMESAAEPLRGTGTPCWRRA